MWLGLAVDDAVEPCRNLAAAARVLASNYLHVVRSSPSTEVAIATAMSLYSTGSRSRGFGNGYVGRVYASSSVVVPALSSEVRRVGKECFRTCRSRWAPVHQQQHKITHRTYTK